MTTLLEHVTDWMEKQKNKHGLRSDYVEHTVNNMSNYEFLEAISDALEEMKSKGEFQLKTDAK